uniref:Minor capsid protein P8 central region domain-containing protein n=1 Tax=viral metagenome TaxID=1070528 RepID=A0A6C0CNU6_9ZZZZ
MEAFRDIKTVGVAWNSKDDTSGWGSILNYNNYNGRLNIVEEEQDPTIKMKMAEKIGIRNKATEYREALSGLQEDNFLAKAYFSEDNIQILQNGLRAGVYEVSNKEIIIPPQNIDNLKIVMRSIYLQYASHTSEISNITAEIIKLNNYVLEYCIKSVYNEAQGYAKYCRDQSTLVMPMERPQQIDRDYKHLEIKTFL